MSIVAAAPKTCPDPPCEVLAIDSLDVLCSEDIVANVFEVRVIVGES